MTERLALYPVFALVLWLASHTFRPRLAAVAIGAAVVAALGLNFVRLPVYVYYSNQVAEYESVAPCIQPNSTLLQVKLWLDDFPRGFRRPGHIMPLADEVSRLAADTYGIDLNNVEGEVPFYLFHFRRSLDPFHLLQSTPLGMDSTPPRVDLLSYNRTTTARVDYVLVFGRAHASPWVLRDAGTQRVERQLSEAYRLVAVSRPTGPLDVYRLRGLSVAVMGRATPYRECAAGKVASSEVRGQGHVLRRRPA